MENEELLKKEIYNELLSLFDAYLKKDIDYIKNKFDKSDTIVAFGTDIDEIIRSHDQWCSFVDNDFKLMEKIEFSEPEHYSVHVSPAGRMGTIICQNKVLIEMYGQKSSVATRISATFKRIDEEWKIVQWMAAFPTEGYSSEELLKEKKPFAK